MDRAKLWCYFVILFEMQIVDYNMMQVCAVYFELMSYCILCFSVVLLLVLLLVWCLVSYLNCWFLHSPFCFISHVLGRDFLFYMPWTFARVGCDGWSASCKSCSLYSQIQSGCLYEYKNLLPLPGMEHFLSCLTSRLFILLTTILQLLIIAHH